MKKNHQQLSGFTLIELLVVVSIMALLSSVALSFLSQAKLKGRDGGKILEVHQFELAIKLYMSDHNDQPPTLNGNCPSSVYLTASNVINCIARSSDNSDAWNQFKNELVSYLKTTPIDTCGTNCAAPAYVYVSPAAMRYYANLTYYPFSGVEQTAKAYQIYTNLEIDGRQVGFKSFGEFFDPNQEYLQLVTRINSNPIDSTNNGSCVSNVVYPPPNGGNNTAGCIRTIKKKQPGVYSVQWLSGYPTGVTDTSQIPSISSIQNGNIQVFFIDFI